MPRTRLSYRWQLIRQHLFPARFGQSFLHTHDHDGEDGILLQDWRDSPTSSTHSEPSQPIEQNLSTHHTSSILRDFMDDALQTANVLGRKMPELLIDTAEVMRHFHPTYVIGF